MEIERTKEQRAVGVDLRIRNEQISGKSEKVF